MLDYDRWRMNSGDEADYPNCYSCEENAHMYNTAHASLASIVKQLYIEKKANLTEVDVCIEELCRLLNVTYPDNPLNIAPKDLDDRRKVVFCEDYIDCSNFYFERAL